MWKKGHRQSYYGTHKLSNTKLYRVYYGIKQRCYNPKVKNYYNYGGRGIVMCNEWENDFRSFYDWAIKSGYKDGLTIDRIDNNKGYSPDNCRWVTYKVNLRNKRTNRVIEFNGEQHSVIEWSEILCIPVTTLYNRLFEGWDIKNTLTTPLQTDKIHKKNKQLQENKK